MLLLRSDSLTSAQTSLVGSKPTGIFASRTSSTRMPASTRVASEFGSGNVVAAGVALTCDIEMGDFNYLNLNVTVGHDVRIGSFNVLNPGANISGGVVMRDQILVGTGAQLLEDVEVRDKAVIGAGAVVVRDVPEEETVVGVPAKPLPARPTPRTSSSAE